MSYHDTGQLSLADIDKNLDSHTNFFLLQNFTSDRYSPIWLEILFLFCFPVRYFIVGVSSQKLLTLCNMLKRGSREYKQDLLKIFFRFKEMSSRQCKWFSHVIHLKCSMFQGAFMLQQRARPVEHPVTYVPAWVQKKIPSNEESSYRIFYSYEDMGWRFLFLIFIMCGKLCIINDKNSWLKAHNRGVTTVLNTFEHKVLRG